MLDFLKKGKEKAGFVFFNCDKQKSKRSMNIFYNTTVYKDVRDSRRTLWQKVKDELAAGNIRIDDKDMCKVRSEILNGEPSMANDFITYGFIYRVDLA